MHKEAYDMLNFYYGGQKRERVDLFEHCPEGYQFVRDTARPNKLIAFPIAKNFRDYPCILFDLKKRTCKGFRIKSDNSQG